MEQIKLYPFRYGQSQEEVILNTPESEMIKAQYELVYYDPLKIYQVRFFIPLGSQIGRWTGVRYFFWRGGKRHERFVTHTLGCYTGSQDAGDSLDALDLDDALYIYSR